MPCIGLDHHVSVVAGLLMVARHALGSTWNEASDAVLSGVYFPTSLRTTPLLHLLLLLGCFGRRAHFVKRTEGLCLHIAHANQLQT